MTALLEQAFAQAAKLSDEEQDLLASWLLTNLNAEDAFDDKIAATADKLAALSRKALEEHRAGLTQELIPEQL